MSNTDESSINVYLKSASKSLELIKTILKAEKGGVSENTSELQYIISNRILPLLAEADIEDECEKAIALRKIVSKLSLSSMVSVINEKTILGIGGRFSAGKSCFINSLIDSNEQLLPEGQLPTTSIATYIIQGQERSNIITNLHGKDISLGNDAVVALNHQFFEKWFGNEYAVDFAQFVTLFVLKSPKFCFENIAMLDTPGYNKYDGRKKSDASDTEKARTELQVVDYLIWLIDIENGVIKEEDLKFLEDNIATGIPVLFVINKADKKRNSDVIQIIEQTRDAIEENGCINCQGVVAYSSFDCKEFSEDLFQDDEVNAYLSKEEGIIWKFLNEININSKGRVNCIEEINAICYDIATQLKEEWEKCDSFEKQCKNLVLDNNDVENLESVIDLYKNSTVEKGVLNRMMIALNNILSDISSLDV